MHEDKTTLNFSLYHQQPSSEAEDPLSLVIGLCEGDNRLADFNGLPDSFTVGRAQDNLIVIDSKRVSRYHLEIKKESNDWWVYDLNSSNGVYIDNQRVHDKEKLHYPVAVHLGQSGFYLSIDVKKFARLENTENKNDQPPFSQDNAAPDVTATLTAVEPPATGKNHKIMTEQAIKMRFLSDVESEDSGEYTKFVRNVIIQERTKREKVLIDDDRRERGKSYKKVIILLSVFLCILIVLAGYQYSTIRNTEKLAIDMFYDIKTLEVSIAQADIKLDESANVLDNTIKAISNEKLQLTDAQVKLEQEKIQAEKLRMKQERKKLASMKDKYQQYLEQAHSLQLQFPSSEQYELELIAKVARELGESELELPEDFVKEVKKYIGYWQSTSRLQNVMDKVQLNDYIGVVITALEKVDLPPYFVYLPLQESDFNEKAIGPKTRYGVAKGAWQLLTSTAQQYGINPGVTADELEYDQQDQRFDFHLATESATKYLKNIYSTQAQASGLLVMASYNYGDNRVRSMINNMPDNPRDRNFWKFRQQYDIPKETHDYVFYIFSAAVIGEDPKHFGFKFSPPLFKHESTEKTVKMQ